MEVPSTMDRNFLRVTSILAFTETKLVLSVCFHINVKSFSIQLNWSKEAADASCRKYSVFWSDRKGQCYARHFVCRMEMVKLSHTVVLRHCALNHVVSKRANLEAKYRRTESKNVKFETTRSIDIIRDTELFWRWDSDPHSQSVFNCMSKLKLVNLKI
jgi:hypothetical protein